MLHAREERHMHALPEEAQRSWPHPDAELRGQPPQERAPVSRPLLCPEVEPVAVRHRDSTLGPVGPLLMRAKGDDDQVGVGRKDAQNARCRPGHGVKWQWGASGVVDKGGTRGCKLGAVGQVEGRRQAGRGKQVVGVGKVGQAWGVGTSFVSRLTAKHNCGPWATA